MTEYRFERETRTLNSESYTIENDQHSLGRVDLHYTSSATHATLAIHTSIDDDSVQDLIGEIDDLIVSSADPYREDFIVTVWRGEEAGVYADDPDMLDLDVDEIADLDSETDRSP